MGLRWYVRWQARILIGQSRPSLTFGMSFERLKFSPLVSISLPNLYLIWNLGKKCCPSRKSCPLSILVQTTVVNIPSCHTPFPGISRMILTYFNS
jgi:hypothetical protein